MTTEQIIDALREQGIVRGRSLGPGGPVGANQTKPFLVPNAYIVTTRQILLKRVGIHLGSDAEKLTLAARAAGENLYVLPPDSKCAGKKSPRQIQHLLLDALWWTRIHVEDRDVFTSIESGGERKLKRARLTCLTGQWENQSAYLLTSNRKWRGLNTEGAAVLLLGRPPRHVRSIETKEGFIGENSLGRERPVRPTFYQRSGPLEYVWFSNQVAVPAVLFDNTIALLQNLNFTWNGCSEPIHVHQSRRRIGIIWPASIFAPEVVSSACRQLGMIRDKRNLAIEEIGGA